jgi:excinuclease ABC subunit A
MKKLFESKVIPGVHKKLEITKPIDRVIIIDQSPIGRTPRSNPATYTKLFDDIRKLLRLGKIETIKYYRENPDSYGVVKGTDLINDYFNDIETLLQPEN